MNSNNILFYCIHAGSAQFVAFGTNYSPSNGTTRAGYLGANDNFTFGCDQFRIVNESTTVQITTAWTLENFMNLDLVSVTERDHPEFNITGTDRGSTLPFPTFRNQLTIVNLTQRLHNVRLYCGHAQDTTDGFWELRVYSESMHISTYATISTSILVITIVQ